MKLRIHEHDLNVDFKALRYQLRKISRYETKRSVW